MAFAITQLIHKNPHFGDKDLYTILADIVVLSTMVALVCSVCISHIDLNMGESSFDNPVFKVLTGISVAVFGIDAIAWIAKSRFRAAIEPDFSVEMAPVPSLPPALTPRAGPREFAELTEEIQSVISHPPELTRIDIVNALNRPCDLITGQIYLGRCDAFVAATHMPDVKKRERNIATNNPLGFRTIITLCSLEEAVHEYQPSMSLLHDEYTDKFSQHAMTWLYVGRNTPDTQDSWGQLVHDCTFLDQHYLPEHEKNVIERSADIWFEAVFAKLDEALAGNQTLIHCHQGVSRSTTILAAYLIKRTGLTTDQVMTFLKSRRACVKSKFIAQLKDYENRLQNGR